MLSGAIARTKMAVEYSNCVVSEPIRANLIGVVTMFNEAVDMLRTRQPEMSQRTSEGGLLMLYLLERQIELDNRQSIVDLKNIPKFTNKLSKRIKDAVDSICNLQESLFESQRPVSLRITKHLDSAVENFYAAVQAFVDDEIELVEKLTTTIQMQVGLCEKLFHSSNTKEPTSQDAIQEEHDLIAQRVNEFKTRIMKLQRLVQNRSSNDALATKRLDAALHFYEQSMVALGENNLIEAERTVTGALLDLDFARQLLLEKGKAKYREL
jgi:hypothetical protein